MKTAPLLRLSHFKAISSQTSFLYFYSIFDSILFRPIFSESISSHILLYLQTFLYISTVPCCSVFPSIGNQNSGIPFPGGFYDKGQKTEECIEFRGTILMTGMVCRCFAGNLLVVHMIEWCRITSIVNKSRWKIFYRNIVCFD